MTRSHHAFRIEQASPDTDTLARSYRDWPSSRFRRERKSRLSAFRSYGHDHDAHSRADQEGLKEGDALDAE